MSKQGKAAIERQSDSKLLSVPQLYVSDPSTAQKVPSMWVGETTQSSCVAAPALPSAQNDRDPLSGVSGSRTGFRALSRLPRTDSNKVQAVPILRLGRGLSLHCTAYRTAFPAAPRQLKSEALRRNDSVSTLPVGHASGRQAVPALSAFSGSDDSGAPTNDAGLAAPAPPLGATRGTERDDLPPLFGTDSPVGARLPLLWMGKTSPDGQSRDDALRLC